MPRRALLLTPLDLPRRLALPLLELLLLALLLLPRLLLLVLLLLVLLLLVLLLLALPALVAPRLLLLATLGVSLLPTLGGARLTDSGSLGLLRCDVLGGQENELDRLCTSLHVVGDSSMVSRIGTAGGRGSHLVCRSVQCKKRFDVSVLGPESQVSMVFNESDHRMRL